MVAFYQLDPWEQSFSEISFKIIPYSCKKIHVEMSSTECWPFYSDVTVEILIISDVTVCTLNHVDVIMCQKVSLSPLV